VLAGLSLALTGCGNGESSGSPAPATPGAKLGVINPPTEPVPEDLVAKAKAEGEVHWYTAATTYELIAGAFEKAYGIKVVANRQNSGAITQQYMTEAASGAAVADIMQAFNPLLYDEAAAKGYFAKLTPNDVPNLSKLPPDLIKNEYYFPSNTWIWGTVWNTDLVPDGIKTWEDLLKPELKGQIVLADPRLGGVSAAFVDWMYNTLGADFLRKLGEQDLQFVDSNVAALDRLGAGEFAVVLPTNKNNPDPLIEKGAPLKFGAPDTTSWFSHDVGISAKAAHPNAARLFANFLLSKEVQEGTSFAGPPIRPDIPTEGMRMLPTYTQLLPKDVTEGVSRMDEFIQLLKIK
jgi:iron(III) transport system substrate-binding protein